MILLGISNVYGNVLEHQVQFEGGARTDLGHVAWTIAWPIEAIFLAFSVPLNIESRASFRDGGKYERQQSIFNSSLEG